MRAVARRSQARRHERRRHLLVHGTEHEVRHGRLRTLPVRPGLRLQGRTGPAVYDVLQPAHQPARDLSTMSKKPKIGVFKFASCDGCQLSLLDCEDELLGRRRAPSRSPTSPRPRDERSKVPYDVSLVEGSVTTHHDAARIHQSAPQLEKADRYRRLRHGRRHSGAAQLEQRRRDDPRCLRDAGGYISTLRTSTPISEHVPVDFELRGCPVNKSPARRSDLGDAGRTQAGDSYP